ncbi:hypothetical protein [Halomicrococcus gelatinilyticus]|uniref:hypothetical protein n=1 Tax=Halomicrococcus gelatinilyticus TaxID=1702103 RepID=UPI002E1102AB
MFQRRASSFRPSGADAVVGAFRDGDELVDCGPPADPVVADAPTTRRSSSPASLQAVRGRLTRSRRGWSTRRTTSWSGPTTSPARAGGSTGSSVLLPFPSLLVTSPLLPLGVAPPLSGRGRTYRWWGTFDVTVER